jgi:hypothetical protein
MTALACDKVHFRLKILSNHIVVTVTPKVMLSGIDIGPFSLFPIFFGCDGVGIGSARLDSIGFSISFF